MYAVMLSIVILSNGITDDQADLFLRRSEVRADLLAGLETVHEGTADNLDFRLGDLQLALLDPHELMLLRNTIFARYGYIFGNGSIAIHFQQYGWYEPTREDVSEFLTETDQRNIASIRYFEDHWDDPGPELPDRTGLSGFWHGNACVGSGYSERYLLFPDGSFIFRENSMDGSARLLEISGEWQMDGSHLILFADSAVYLQGGQIVEPYASVASDYLIQGGEEMQTVLDPPLTFRLPLDCYTADYSTYSGSEEFEHLTIPYMMIGTGGFWRMHADPSFE